ncbi:NAD(P)H-hydrate dehydratase [Conexibacter sp. SYSU D00693]|uniref:NAD(P)H-hydrate dehydratase n=1 Tax=Conexibacter sp. SYSU D00693 TaxID=2812560 RepID=UPI00196A2542|nr:NAD(P)H-hydrate dehydratase [Conexibacter sp. SYSU D00693]
MSLPPWLEPLPDAAQMRETDRWAIEERGIPGTQLMERAGTALADGVARCAAGGRVAVVCGGGNNGGDGYVAARVLAERGREVVLLAAKDPSALRGDAAWAAGTWDGPVAPFSPEALAGASVVVDCLLGTGVTGAPREDAAAVIRAMREGDVPVVACDVPSGVDASTGEVAGDAVDAVLTVTFHRAKPGLWIAPGKQHAGEVEVVGIGIPDGAPVAPEAGLLRDEVLDLHPARAVDGTKFASGHVLVVGGSRGLTGAPCLAASAAMRAGAGYVTACVPASLEPIFEVKLTEVMTAALPDDEAGALRADAASGALSRTDRGGALVLGPGLGRADGALACAREVAARAEVALVLDADGLNAHAGRIADLAARTAPTILTPHGGELARLLDVDSDEVRAHRLALVRRAAKEAGAIVVLKGDDTLVCTPDGTVAVSPGGAPALATAGTGDVLSGVVGAFVARGMEPFAAACAAVHVHAEAGRRLAVSLGAEGVIAGDVVDELPLVLRG